MGPHRKGFMAHAAIAAIASRWQTHFDGHLITQEHAEYDRSRQIWNGMIDRRPALIARCFTPADVIHAVKLARAEALPVSIRGGGHGVAGTAVCDAGIMIDLSPMKDIRVD